MDIGYSFHLLIKKKAKIRKVSFCKRHFIIIFLALYFYSNIIYTIQIPLLNNARNSWNKNTHKIIQSMP